ncbi:MAG: bifunctional nuclease family protein [Candidatus Bipolaricaulia bacterium]
MRRMQVKALLLDATSNIPVVLLEDPDSQMVMPIWIGMAEAQAIIFQMQQQDFPRPLTHDLMKVIIEQLGGKLEQVVINSIQDQAFHATLFVRTDGGEVREIDARPSDSIALALRTESPIYIADDVFDEAAIESPFKEGADEEEEEDKQKFQEFIQGDMSLEDFKKFKR